MLTLVFVLTCTKCPYPPPGGTAHVKQHSSIVKAARPRRRKFGASAHCFSQTSYLRINGKTCVLHTKTHGVPPGKEDINAKGSGAWLWAGLSGATSVVRVGSVYHG